MYEIGKNDIVLRINVLNQNVIRVDTFVVFQYSRNFYYIQFTFSEHWDNLLPTIILSKGEHHQHLYTDDNGVLKIPNEYMHDLGKIEVSCFAGDLRVINSALISVVKSGFKDETTPPDIDPLHTFVKTPNNSVPLLREVDDEVEYFSTDLNEWRAVVKKDDIAMGVW